MQPSPEPVRGRDVDIQPPPLQLPESILFQKTGASSFSHSPASGSAMSEALKTAGIIRRLSNRAQQLRRRRQSSAASHSRDGSVGPAILRRRSDSNTTERHEFALDIDSDDDIVGGREDFLYMESRTKGLSSASTVESLEGCNSEASSSAAAAGPIVPLSLESGTTVYKLSGKKKMKRITLFLDVDSAKVSWGSGRQGKTLKCLYIDDIKEVKTGPEARQYMAELQVSESDRDKFFTILYHVTDNRDRFKLMHILTDDPETRLNWTETLENVSKHRQDKMISLMAFNDKAVREFWASEMRRRFADRAQHSIEEERLDRAGVEQLCKSLHIHVSQSYIHSRFHVADVSKTGYLNHDEFLEFVRLMKRRDDVREIYNKAAADPESGMTYKEFLAFLRNVQHEDIESGTANWESIFRHFTRPSKTKDAAARHENSDGIHDRRMQEAQFASYLSSTFNTPVADEPENYTFDRPMNEYFISSSHNTYLTGRQYGGISSTEGYISALNRGCRCIEIDCWDGNDGQPLVMHGRSLTASIKFRDVMEVISRHAFSKSHFPLWISLEVHCSPAQQALMTSIMKETLGDRLVTEPLDPCSETLPSPSQLMDRILIKVKRPLADEPVNGEHNAGRRRGASLTSPFTRPTILDNASVPPQVLSQSPVLSPTHTSCRATPMRANSLAESTISDAVSSSCSENESSSERNQERKRGKNGIIKLLGDLGVYCMGITFSGFDSPSSKLYNHIYSFMESTFAAHTKTREAKNALYRHNMRYMMRVYPERTRVASSNFDPLIYWRRGVQMAALNWQTYDLGMQLNQAMFYGGKDYSGYVLKPSEMREIQVIPTEDWHGKLERKEVSFSIEVVSLQQLINVGNNRDVNPYVEMEVFHANDKRAKGPGSSGAAGASETHKYRTRIVEGNGFNPIFKNTWTTKLTIKYPDLVFIRMSVKLSPNGHSYASDRSRPIATFTAKLYNLKQGYRTLPLVDVNGDRYLFSTLFCHIKVDPPTKVYVPRLDDAAEGTNKFSSLRKTVFNRSSNISISTSSPKASMDSSWS